MRAAMKGTIIGSLRTEGRRDGSSCTESRKVSLSAGGWGFKKAPRGTRGGVLQSKGGNMLQELVESLMRSVYGWNSGR